MRLILATTCAAAASAAAQASPATVPLDPGARHTACVQAIASDPEAAFEEALVWRHQAGGWPAEHCVSLALIALGQLEYGADRMRAAAAGAVSATDATRAIMYGQAGDAYLEAELDEQALSAFTSGVEYNPSDAGLRRGQAEAALRLGDAPAAEAYASDAIAADPQDAEALRLRGEARFAQDDLTGAEDDMRAARALAPDNVEILLLRGRINEARRIGRVITLD